MNVLDSLKNDPLIWPTIEENDVTRPRKYSKLTHADAIQADCDIKATNIILQGLPPEAAVQNSNSSAQQDALILSVIEQLKTQVVNCTKINLDNKSVNDTLTAERYKEQVKVLKEGQNVDLKSKDNVSDSCEQSVEIDYLKQTLLEHVKEKESLMQTVTLLKNDFKKEESRNINRDIALEKKIKQLDNILEPKLCDGNVIKNTSDIVIPDSEETLVLTEESHPTPSCRPTKVEVPKELLKVSMINTSLKKFKHHLAGFDVVVKERTTATAITEGSWGASGSQPSGNIKKDKIRQTPSSTQKNKVEAHSRTVKPSLKNKNYVEPKGSANVQNSKLNADYEILCVKCNGCILSDNHDLCVLDFINDVNARAKSKSVKKGSKEKVWKQRKTVSIIFG
ncbi:hypothetical protein Tco_0493087 [Tanacetum coccineum]